MARCRIDKSITRVVKSGFVFPLGVYPVEEITPKPGYTSAFEPADGDTPPPGFGGGASGGSGGGGRSGQSGAGKGEGGGEPGEWEEWPDRYVFDILVPATRLEGLCRSLIALLPGRIYPIVDFLGADEWREVDPYVSYDLIGVDRFLETVRRFSGFFFEDGLVGFGAMSEEPFVYVFVDEHKVVTVRVQADLKEKVEAVLQAFDLEPLEELLSADSAVHEHRTVLETPEGRTDLLGADEIMEGLRDEWRLVLNIDPDANLDEDGNDLGMTGWRCIVRYDPPPVSPSAGVDGRGPGDGRGEDDEKGAAGGGGAGGAESKAIAAELLQWPESRYCQVFLTADSLNRATDLAYEALETLLAKEGKTLDVEPAGDDPELGGVDEDEAEATGAMKNPEPVVVQADRWGEGDFAREVESVTGQKPDMDQSGVCFVEWLS
jgi:hypothetical protein